MSGRHLAEQRPGSDAVLEVLGVGLTYRSGGAEVTALAGVDLAVERGRLVCLAGPSGSGKSTLCHLVGGFETPTTGTVRVLGRDPREVRDWSVLACVPQRLALLPELTVAESVALPRAFAGGGTHPSADPFPSVGELLERLGLAAIGHRRVGETSLGEQQRTAIARAASTAPALLVLDEPTGHQDDDHVAVVLAALVAVARSGAAVLVSTHDDRVLEVADRVVRLAEGRVAG